MTIAASVNGRRFTVLDIVERFKLLDWVERDPTTVDELKKLIGPGSGGLDLACDGEEVLPCQENAIKALESLAAAEQEAILIRIYDLPSVENLRERIRKVPSLAQMQSHDSR